MKDSPRFTPNSAVSLLRKYILLDPESMVVDFEKSQGSYFHDAVTGRDYLDFYTFFASLPIGFNHPKILEPSFLADIQRAGLCKVANSDVLSIEYAEFVDTFRRIALPDGFNHLFFISGGALAVENALKTAFDWKIRKNLEKGIEDKGAQIIHFKQAFHGRTGYTLSLTNSYDPNKTKYFPKFKWPRITSPFLRFPVTDKDLQETMAIEEQAVREIKQAFIDNADDVAAIIIEPIQGEGGDNHFRPEFMRSLRILADENEALLIFDEVQTGVGLTGRMWCSQHFDFMPDIICFGKKMQVGGIMCTERIQEVDSVFKVQSRINSTFGASLVDMVRCARYLEIIESEHLVANADCVGRLLMEGLGELAKKYKVMSNVRGRGLMIAFDLPSNNDRNVFRRNLVKEGCMVLSSGEKSIRLRPPLNLSHAEAVKGVELIGKVLKSLYDRSPHP